MSDLPSNNLISPEAKSKLEEMLKQKCAIIKNKTISNNFNQYYKNKIFALSRQQFKQNKIVKIVKNVKKEQKFDDIIAQNIIKILLHFPQLIDVNSSHYKLEDINFENEKLNQIKDFIFDLANDDNDCSQIKQKLLDNFNFDQKLIASFYQNDEILVKSSEIGDLQMQILLAKYHLHQIDQQITNDGDMDKKIELTIYKNKIAQDINDIQNTIIYKLS